MLIVSPFGLPYLFTNDITQELDRKVTSDEINDVIIEQEEVSSQEIVQRPRLNQFRFSPILDWQIMRSTECVSGEVQAVVLPSGETVSFTIMIESTWKKPMVAEFFVQEIQISGVETWFEEPTLILQPFETKEVELFISSREDVGDHTTFVGWRVHVSEVDNPALSSGNSDWLYLMIGEEPNLPQLFTFYPTIRIGENILYKPGDSHRRLFLEIQRGSFQDIIVELEVKSKAGYSVNYTFPDVYLFPEEGVSVEVTPKIAIAEPGKTMTFVLRLEVDSEFVGLGGHYPSDDIRHEQDLYMYLDLGQFSSLQGYCDWVNEGQSWASALYFEMDSFSQPNRFQVLIS